MPTPPCTGPRNGVEAGIELYDQQDDPWTVRRLRTGNDLHRALERNEFELHYQPFVDLHTTTLVGVEALVRWRHPTRGLLAPGEFIDLAEDTGLIVPLGYWVIGEACRQAVAWREAADRGRAGAVAIDDVDQRLAPAAGGDGTSPRG